VFRLGALPRNHVGSIIRSALRPGGSGTPGGYP